MSHPRSLEKLLRLALVTTLVVSVLSSASASAHHEEGHDHGPPDCVESYRNYPGTGRACRNERGNYNVPVGNGKVLETHGPDAAPAAPGGTKGKPGGGGGSGGGTTTPPPTYKGGVCTSAGFRSEIIYAVAHDDYDDYANMAPKLRSQFVDIDSYLNSEAGQFGAQMHYKVLCDPDGQPTVHRAVLPNTSRNNFSFYSITNGLDSLGFDDPEVNYWVYFDETFYYAAGQGNFCTVYSDQNYCRESRWTASYGISYGYLDLRVFMHENGHNMGAVQDSAPNSSGGAHCNDGMDIMCYADGASTSNYRSDVCSGRYHFDCNHDDYFHPHPAAGTYLADNWNLASCLNNFLVSSYCNKPPQVTAPMDRVCVVLVQCDSGPARASDVDGDMRSWQWSFTACPGACPALQRPDGGPMTQDRHNEDMSIYSTYFTPSASGTYRLSVAVTDEYGNVGSDEMTITVP